MVKFGAPVFPSTEKNADFDPELYAAKHKEKGFTSAYVPRIDINDKELIKAFRETFKREGIVLAEAGYWENIMDMNRAERTYHRNRMLETFFLAEELGAGCAVNIFGSYCHGNGNSRHCAMNFSNDAFADAVDMARYFIDTVKPKTAYFTYEIFPINFIDSVESMLKLVKAVDRERFGVHFDLVNMINSPRTYFGHIDIINETVKLLGGHIVSAHLKDIKLKEPAISVILEEVPPGSGIINFGVLMKALNGLPRDTPALIEHLPDEAAYDAAASYIRKEAEKAGVRI